MGKNITKAPIFSITLACLCLLTTGCNKKHANEIIPPVLEEQLTPPEVLFELDANYKSIVKRVDMLYTWPLLVNKYGVDTVFTENDLKIPGMKLKYLAASDGDPLKAQVNLPDTVWKEAQALLPVFQKAWNTRGNDLLKRMLKISKVPFIFDKKTVKLYLCPGLAGAYNMKAYPFYPYLKTVYGTQAWPVEAFTDWYMFHELIHWYLLEQPSTRKWTPLFNKYYYKYVNSTGYDLPPVVLPEVMANVTYDIDHQPEQKFNMVNFIGHLHMNALRYKVLNQEPGKWEFVKLWEKAVTADDYYGHALDIMDTLAINNPSEIDEFIQEIQQNAYGKKVDIDAWTNLIPDTDVW